MTEENLNEETIEVEIDDAVDLPQQEDPEEEPKPVSDEEAIPDDTDDATDDAEFEKVAGEKLRGKWRGMVTKTRRQRDKLRSEVEIRDQALASERAAREAAQKEAENALLYANAVRQQAEEHRRYIEQVTPQYKRVAEDRFKERLSAIQIQQQDALEKGDMAKVAALATEAAQTAAQLTEVQRWSPAKPDPVPEFNMPQPNPGLTLARQWGEKNHWYFPDSPTYDAQRAGRAAMVNQYLIDKGMNPNQPQFYAAIDYLLNQEDQRMSTNNGTPSAPQPKPASPPVAGVSQGGANAPNNGKVTLKITEQDRIFAKQLNIDPAAIVKQRYLDERRKK